MAWSLVGVSARVNDSAGDATLVEPTGAAEGDLIVAFISYRDTSTWTVPAGWTKVAEENLGDGAVDGIASGCMAFIVRGATAPSYVFTNAGSLGSMSYTAAWRGNSLTPLDVSSSLTAATASTALSTGSISPGQAEELIVAFGVTGASTTAEVKNCNATDPGTAATFTIDQVTAPTVGTWILRQRNQTALAGGMGMGFFDAVKSGSGATGTITAESNGAITRGVMIAASFKQPLPALSGSLSGTLDAATLDSHGHLAISGTAALALDDATLAAAGDANTTGAVAATLADATLTSDGALALSGGATATLAPATLSSEGALAIRADLSVALEDVTAVSLAGDVLEANVAVALDQATLSSAGALAVTGSLSATLEDATLFSGPITGTLGLALDDATLDSEIWGVLHTPVPALATPTPSTFTYSTIAGWDGAGRESASLLGHESSSEHHVSVILSDPAATGVLRLRLVPTKMTKPVALGDETEFIDIALLGGHVSFIVGGFYSSIEASFITALSAGKATITVASNITEDENDWPRTTVITTNWDGVGTVSKSMPDHAGLALHHIAIACETQPSAGSILIRGRPAGSAGGHVTLAGPYYLTGTGTVNVTISGFYDEFSIKTNTAMVDAGAIQARVASVFGVPLLSEDFPPGGRLGVPVPAAANSAGSKGDIAWDASYLYVCVDANVWRRAGLVAW